MKVVIGCQHRFVDHGGFRTRAIGGEWGPWVRYELCVHRILNERGRRVSCGFVRRAAPTGSR